MTRFAGLMVALALAGCATTQSPGSAGADAVPPPVASADVAAGVAAAPAPAASAAAARPRAAAAPSLDDEAARTDLWARVRRGFAMPELDGALVADRERWYASRPDYVERMTTRSSRYMFYIVEELERRGLPTEIALLPYVESAFNPQAVSSARASGMWQFMAATGKDFDLKQNLFRDDRRDVLASTRAALDYLTRLYTEFGDWQLALAAYNWGEGNVRRAIAKNRKAGLPEDYASLKMPEETRTYVPKLQAVKNIVADPERFGIVLPALANHPYFLRVPIEGDIDVALAVRLAGVTLEEFRILNPQMNKPVILAAGTPQVLLPYDNANRFLHGLAAHQGATASWTAWVAPRTLKPADAAKAVGMSEATLREVNAIPPRMLVKAGSTLLVPRGSAVAADVSEHLADNAALALAPDLPPLRKVSFKAGRQDSVASVAKRYRVSAAQVAQWNRLAPGARFKAGQKVVVYTPVKPAKAGKAGVRLTAAKPEPKVRAKTKPQT
ncbi:MAG: transglycosylase SLT domain-containing protein [Ideonella sp.]|nr:transglycosylase SLT domain-containing protein [Ideonella sp.]